MNTPTISFPRKKHSHRCKICKHGVYCYKSQCALPQRLEMCVWCKHKLGKVKGDKGKENAEQS